MRIPTLALLYSLYNCTESFFRQKESQNLQHLRLSYSYPPHDQYHENVESSIKMLKYKKYILVLLSTLSCNVKCACVIKNCLAFLHVKHPNIPAFLHSSVFSEKSTIFGNQKLWQSFPDKKMDGSQRSTVSYQSFFFGSTEFPGQKRAAKRALASQPTHQSFLRLKN